MGLSIIQRMRKKRKNLKIADVQRKIFALTLACLLSLCLFSGDIFVKDEVQAADAVQQVSNLVVFVNFPDDTEDVFNKVYSITTESYSKEYKNWEIIKKLYDCNYDIHNAYDNSFKNYIYLVSEGKCEVTNYFPQEAADGNSVNTYKLSKNSSSYSSNEAIVQEVIRAISTGSIPIDASYDLDHLSEGVLDNLTVVIQRPDGYSSPDFQAEYGGSEKIQNNLLVRNYNMLNSNSIVASGPSTYATKDQGVIAHEFLHSLGWPDLYRNYGDTSGKPVGQWDIMANASMYMNYPLAYLRSNITCYRDGEEKAWNWVQTQEVSTAGTYTLTAASETGGIKAFVVKTPLSSTESIVFEYRKSNPSNEKYTYNRLDRNIDQGGLLIYRVDDSVQDHTNVRGEDYIYVYRPGVTSLSNADANANLAGAAICPQMGETSYGSTDLNATLSDNILFYANGTNSGIKVSNVRLSADEKSLTFDLSFADYSNVTAWTTVGGAFGSEVYTDADLYVDSTGQLYTAYSDGYGSTASVQVKKLTNNTFENVGTKITGATDPKIVVCGNELYLCYLKSTNYHPVFCKWNGSSWQTLKEYSTDAQYLKFVEDGNNLYASFVANGTTLNIVDVKKSTVIDSSLSVGDSASMINPQVVKLLKKYYVLYSDYSFGGSNKAKVAMLDTEKKSWTNVHTYSLANTKAHAMEEYNGKLYVYASNSSGAVMSVYDGAEWKDSTVSDMTSDFISMDVIEDEMYVSYLDTSTYRIKIGRKNGDTIQWIDSSLSGKYTYVKSASYGNTLYLLGTVNEMYKCNVFKKDLSLPDYKVSVSIPSGYSDTNLWIDGVSYSGTKSNGKLSTTIHGTNAKTAVMYQYNANGVPIGMYCWKLTYANNYYKAEALVKLENLLSYHGFSIRIKGDAGIRFKSGIDSTLKTQLTGDGVSGYTLKEYGSMFMLDSNRATYPFTVLSKKTEPGRSYWVENGKINDNVFETKQGRQRFTAVQTKLPQSYYATEMAFRSYIILDNGGDSYIFYGPPMSRSIYTIAKQIKSSGEFKQGSNEYIFIDNIIQTVEK